MRFMTDTKKKISIYILVLSLLLIGGQVFALEQLTDLSVTSYGRSGIILFPSQTVKNFHAGYQAPNVMSIDFYDWSFPQKVKIIPAPHSSIKFMRISQVSRQPDVVRAVIVFRQAIKFVARVVDRKLVLEAAIPLAYDRDKRVKKIDDIVNTHYNVRSTGSNTVLDKKVSLNFVQEDLMTIINALALKFNLRIFADAGVKGRFSVHAQDVSLREVLKSLLLKRDFQYTLKGRDLTIISLGHSSSRMARELLFKDLSLKDALQTLSKMMNLNLIIHESVEDKKVNFYVENLNLDELLDLLIETNDLVKEPRGDNTFIILTKEAAKSFGKKKYRTFKLTNAKPDEIVKAISDSKALSEKIDTSNFSVNERINALSVYDTPENLNLIERIIESLDEKVKQVVVEVKLVEINRTSLKQLGVRLDNYGINVSDIGRLPTNYALPATLDFLEEERKAKVLASPKIRVVHGKTASINIGEVIPVPYYDYSTSAAASSTTSYAPPVVYKRYKDVHVGIELTVKPEITRDNEISMELNTRVDSVLDINDDGQIHKSERKTDTYVRIKNGETVVLGGLINHRGSTAKKSPSLLSKVPLLRGLFSNTKYDMQDSEMIMLVTPRLVNLDYYDNQVEKNMPGLIIEKKGSVD